MPNHPTPPAPKLPGAPNAAQQGGVRPIPVRDLQAIFAPRPQPKVDLNARFAANDRYGDELTPRLTSFFRRRGDRLFWLLIGATIGLFLADAIVLVVRL